MFNIFRAWYYNIKYPFMKPIRCHFIWGINNYHITHWSEAFTPIPLEKVNKKEKYKTLDLFTINEGKKFLAYKILFLDWIDDFLCKYVPHKYTAFNWIPYGWRKSFGKQLCDELKWAILKDGGRKLLKTIKILDIKEKDGELDMDFNGYTTRMDKVLHKYAYISRYTCIICGDLAVGHTPYEYWECPYCEEHKPENSKYFLYYGISYEKKKGKKKEIVDGPSWYGLRGNVNDLSPEDYENAQKNFQEYIELREKC